MLLRCRVFYRKAKRRIREFFAKRVVVLKEFPRKYIIPRLVFLKEKRALYIFAGNSVYLIYL